MKGPSVADDEEEEEEEVRRRFAFRCGTVELVTLVS